MNYNWEVSGGGESALEANRACQCEATNLGSSSPKWENKPGHHVLEHAKNTGCLQ